MPADGAEQIKNLTDNQFVALSWPLAEFYRTNPDPQQQLKAAQVYLPVTVRFSKEWASVVYLLTTAFDHGQTELAKAATLQMLTFDAPPSHSDLWRRMYANADKLNDAELVKQIFAWEMKCIAKNGLDVGFCDSIGDVLVKHGLKAETLAFWQKVITEGDPNNPWYLQAAIRLLPTKVGPDPAKPSAEWTAFIQGLLAKPSDYHGNYATWLAQAQFAARDLDNFEKTLAADRIVQNERPFRGWGFDAYTPQTWIDAYRGK